MIARSTQQVVHRVRRVRNLAAFAGVMVTIAACGDVDTPRATTPSSDSVAASASASVAPLTALNAVRDVSIMGAFAERDIKESSAAVQSHQFAGVFWTLNDSGNNERLFAFDTSGADLGTIKVSGVRNRDWESLAVGPCESGHCLYIGETGDNLARHDAVTIWRIAEPAPPGAGQKQDVTGAVPLHFTYPDGPRDVEAIWVDADTIVWLATKRPITNARGEPRQAQLYRLLPSHWNRQDTAFAELVDSLPNVPVRDLATQVTDASLSNPFGDSALVSRLAVRTYERLYVFRVAQRSGQPDSLLGACDLRPLDEKQGEGITWLPDGRVLLTSEKRFAPLRALRCP